MIFDDLLSNDEMKDFSESLNKLFEDTEKLLDEEHPLEEEIDFKMSDILAPLCLNNLKNNPQYYYQKFKIIFVKFLTLDDYFFRMKKGENETPHVAISKKSDNKDLPKFIKNINKFKIALKRKLIRDKRRDRNISVKDKTEYKLDVINETKDRKKRNLSENKRITSIISDNSTQINDISKELLNKISRNPTDSSEKKISNSLSYEQKQGLKGIGYNFKEEEKKEYPDYKLKLIKSNLNLEDNEEMSGKAYEDYARKILKIMFIIITKKEIFFENPSKIIFSKLIDFYLKKYFRCSFDIDTPIRNIIYNNIQDGNELDIVYDCQYKDLLPLSNRFKKYILIDGLQPNKNIIIDLQEDDKITIIGEIAKNIIKQGKEKLNQILNYIKIISIMNTIKKSNLVNDEKYKEICNDYKCANDSEKILFIITDGDYVKLNIIISFIKDLIRSNISEQSNIKQIISEFIKSKINIFKEETNFESLIENIYCNYLIFENLKKNDIKYVLLYIGDITNINYEEIFESIFKKEKDMNTSKSPKKLNIDNIKKNYVQLKTLIKEFEKNLSNITRLKARDLKPIFEEMENSIKSIYISQNCTLFKKIYNNIKFDAFMYFPDSAKSIIKDICNTPAMSKLINRFNLKIDILSGNEIFHLLKKVRECPDKYGRKIIFLVNEVNYYIKNILFEYSYFPPIIKNIFYRIKKIDKPVFEKMNKTNKPNNKELKEKRVENKEKKKLNESDGKESSIIKVGFEFPDDFYDTLPFKTCINKIFDKEIKKTKKLYTNDCLLLKENLCQKIIFDLNNLFQKNENSYPFIEILKKTQFDLYGDKNSLISFHIKALNLFKSMNEEIDTEKKKEIINNITSKLDILAENILSLNIYTVIFMKIEEIINKLTADYFKFEMSQFKTTISAMTKKENDEAI